MDSILEKHNPLLREYNTLIKMGEPKEGDRIYKHGQLMKKLMILLYTLLMIRKSNLKNYLI